MAFRRFRRRRSGGKWFETLLNTGVVNDSATAAGTIVATQILKGNAPFNPTAGGNAGQVLSAMQTFLHKRTIGDIFYGLTATVQTTVPKLYTMHSGIAVIEVDDVGTPIGLNRWAPASNDATDLPWMWRRAWTMFMPSGTAVGDTITNVFQGLPLGPWLDVKVRRAMRRQTDLFVVDQLFENQFTGGVWQPTITPTQIMVARGVHLRSFLRPVVARW